MNGILILYQHRGRSPGLIPKAAGVGDRALSLDVHMEEPVPTSSVRGFRRASLAAASVLGKSSRNVVTLYPRYSSAKMRAVRSAALQASPGTNERMLVVLPFFTHDGRDERGFSELNVRTHLARSPGAIPYQMKELLSAALANSHACQNWLNSDTPNLERARQSIVNLTRDLNLAAQMV
jgi:hypothetical protein